jgi:hypothetical protein
MHDVAYLTVGRDKLSWVLPGNYQIAGITVDNPSGSWLLIPQDNTYIPPYTSDFAHSFRPTLARVDVKFVTGPASQPSTLQGDRPFCQIWDTPVGESNGVTSSTGTEIKPLATNTIDTVVFGQQLFNSFPADIIPAQANARCRLYQFRIGHSTQSPPVQTTDFGIWWRLQPNPFPTGGSHYVIGEVEPGRGYDEVRFDVNPRDFPLSFAVAVMIVPRWPGIGSVFVDYHIRYAIV